MKDAFDAKEHTECMTEYHSVSFKVNYFTYKLQIQIHQSKDMISN